MVLKDVEKFFEKCINKINDYLKNLFWLKNGWGIFIIIFVGGFVELLMFLEGIKLIFFEMCIIVLKDVLWFVFWGVVIFGYDLSLIR